MNDSNINSITNIQKKQYGSETSDTQIQPRHHSHSHATPYTTQRTQSHAMKNWRYNQNMHDKASMPIGQIQRWMTQKEIQSHDHSTLEKDNHKRTTFSYIFILKYIMTYRESDHGIPVRWYQPNKHIFFGMFVMVHMHMTPLQMKYCCNNICTIWTPHRPVRLLST